MCDYVEGVGKLTPSFFLTLMGRNTGMTVSQVIENVSGVLIAGGKSRRMGQDKRLLTVGGTSVFRRTLGLLQQEVPVLPDDSPTTLQARVFAAECEAYPQALRMLAASSRP